MHDAELLSRRSALQIGGLGLLGLTMPRLLRAAETPARLPIRAKSVIFLYQFGGPSHLDTFDVKPEAPDGIRSPLGTIATSMPGLRISQLLPATSKVMDKVTLVHGVHHGMKNHNSASYYALSGHEPPVDDIRLQDTNALFPAYGSIADRFAPELKNGASSAVPKFVAYPYTIRDGSITPGQRGHVSRQAARSTAGDGRSGQAKLSTARTELAGRHVERSTGQPPLDAGACESTSGLA